jgi:hypothetical protein
MLNPFSHLADILRELYRLVGRHPKNQNKPSGRSWWPIPELFDRHLSHEMSWENCMHLARQMSVSRGIPFNAFDPVLREADEAFRTLLHIAAGDVGFPGARVPGFLRIEKRLRQLASTYTNEGETPAVGTGAREGAYKKPHTKKATTNALMLEAIQKNRDAMGWSSTQWAKEIKRSKSAIVETETWNTFKAVRDTNRAMRARDRQHRPRHYGAG